MGAIDQADYMTAVAGNDRTYWKDHCGFFLPGFKAVTPRYKTENMRDVPPYMKGSVYEITNLANVDPSQASGYGLVGRLRATGDTTAPTSVRQWMVKEMVKHAPKSVVGMVASEEGDLTK